MGTSEGALKRSCLWGGQLDHPPGAFTVSPQIKCAAGTLSAMCVCTVRVQLSLPTALLTTCPGCMQYGLTPCFPSAPATETRPEPFSVRNRTVAPEGT